MVRRGPAASRTAVFDTPWRATAVLLLGGVLGLAGGCGDGAGGDDSGASVTLQPLATVDPSPQAVSTLPDDVTRMADGRLARGQSYTTSRFGVPVGVTVPDQMFGLDTPAFFGLTTDPTDPVGRPGIVFVLASDARQINPPVLSAQDAIAAADDYASPLPADIPGWLEANPYLNVSDREQTTVGGRSAVAYDYRVGGLPDEPLTCVEIRCLIAFDIPDEVVHVLPDGKVGRIFVVDLGDDTMIIEYGGPPDQLATFRPAFEALLASARIG